MIYRSIDWRRTVTRFVGEDDGPSATEYAILLAVLILGSMGIIQSVGEGFRGVYLAIAQKIPDVQ